jgi:hypothetical protein
MGFIGEVTGRVKRAAGALLGSEPSPSEGHDDARGGERDEHDRLREGRASAEQAKADARFEERRTERAEQTAAARERARRGR